MMPPGHVAVTWAAADFWPEKHLDYRLLAFCALLPDLIDKPLAIWVFTDSHSAQNVAHALLPNLALMLIALLWQRRALPYVLAFNAHLIADRMWNHTETFWWPLFGWDVFWQFKFMNTPQAMLDTYLDIVQRYPQVWVVELIAVAYLVRFVGKSKLFLWKNLNHFLRTGRLAGDRTLVNQNARHHWHSQR